MADDYYIDILYPDHVGFDAYEVRPSNVSGRVREKLPLFYTLETGDTSVVYPPREIPDSVSGLLGDIAHGFSKVGHDIIHTANTAAKLAGKVAGKLAKPLKDVVALNPIVAIGGFAVKLAKGQRIDKAFLSTAKAQIQAAREVLPYAKLAVSMVPGVGSGIAAGIAAGTALAEGRTVSSAVLEAAEGMVPGGEIGKLAYRAAVKISHGNSITDAALKSAIEELPSAAQSAANVAIAAAKGKNVREAALQAIREQLPTAARKAVDIGLALGIARNVQNHVIQQVSNPSVLNKLAREPVQPILLKAIPRNPSQDHGYRVASALLCYTGVTAHALAAARQALNHEEQKGFDHAMRIYNAKVEKTHRSLVRGGLVLRGNWRAARASDKNVVQGRVIEGNKVVHGAFVRV